LKHILSIFYIALVLIVFPVVAQPTPTGVFVSPVKMVDFVDEIEALGTLQANENVDLVSNVTERIIAINFQDNQTVAKGDVLIEMDIAQEQAELIEEQSVRDEARKQVNRLTPLVKRGVASQAALDEQQRNLKTSRARIKAIESRIQERSLVAPFDGVVGIRNISVGALARPETIITTLDDISVMKLDFSVPEIYLASLREGIMVEASTSAYPDILFTGTVTSLDSRVNPITRSIGARALLQNDQNLLKAGMLMRVNLKSNPRQTLIVPEESIITTGQDSIVMVIDENNNAEDTETATVRRQKVSLGARRKGEVEILEGLTEGEQVVTHGTLKIRPGTAVIVKAVETDNETLREMLDQANGE